LRQKYSFGGGRFGNDAADTAADGVDTHSSAMIWHVLLQYKEPHHGSFAPFLVQKLHGRGDGHEICNSMNRGRDSDMDFCEDKAPEKH